MNDIQVFNNPEFGEIRTVEINNEPWFVGKDVAEALGFSNSKDAILNHVDEDDRKVLQRSEMATFDIPNRGLTIINESGLYSLVLSSKLPTAKKFKRWVTSEVLPSIRKHGAYMTPETLEKMVLTPDFGIRLLTELKAEQDKRKALEATVEEQKPHVLFSNAVSASKTTILIGALAKLLKQNGINIGQNRLFEWLRQNGFLVKRGDNRNMPTQRAMELGLFEVKESCHLNSNGCNVITKTTVVTGKGQCYFINRFLGKQNGVAQ